MQRDYETTIANLRHEINSKTTINIQQDNTDFDGIINSYKNKIAQLNSQLSEYQRTIDSMRSEYQSRRVNESKTTNIIHHGDENLRLENAILN